MFIKNLRKEDNTPNNTIIFDLVNEGSVFVALASGLRRTISSNIGTYCMDMNQCTFYENNSILNNEFLKHRLNLIPVFSNKEFDYDNIKVRCKIKNENEMMMSVYPHQFEITDEKSGTQIKPEDFFPYPNILFAKLKYNQYFSFECGLSYNSQEIGGSFHCPVCTCIYTYKIDEKQVAELTKSMDEESKATFLLEESERIYYRNKKGDPLYYEWKLESNGFYPVEQLFPIGIQELKRRMQLFEKELDNPNSLKIEWKNHPNQESMFELHVQYENETLGEIISNYINQLPNVIYAGYLIPHPLKKILVFKVSVEEKKKEKCIEAFHKACSNVYDILDPLLSEFEGAAAKL